MKISALPVLTTPAKEDSIPVVDASASTTKQMTLATMLNLTYPIGTVFTNTVDATNPATLLGFGTWAALTDRVLVGKAASGTFSTIGANVGAETVALTASQNGTHSHGASTDVQGVHSHGITGFGGDSMIYTSGGGSLRATNSGSAQQLRTGGLSINADGGHGHNVYINNSGDGAPHNNIQPSKVVYMWERTA